MFWRRGPTSPSGLLLRTDGSVLPSAIIDLVSHASFTTVESRAVVSGFWEGKICGVEVALINLALIAPTDMSPPRVLDREIPRVERGSSMNVVSSGFQVPEGFKSRGGPGTFWTDDDDPARTAFFEGGSPSSSASRFLFTPLDVPLTPRVVGELAGGGARLTEQLDTGVGNDLPAIDCD